MNYAIQDFGFPQTDPGLESIIDQHPEWVESILKISDADSWLGDHNFEYIGGALRIYDCLEIAPDGQGDFICQFDNSPHFLLMEEMVCDLIQGLGKAYGHFIQ